MSENVHFIAPTEHTKMFWEVKESNPSITHKKLWFIGLLREHRKLTKKNGLMRGAAENLKNSTERDER